MSRYVESWVWDHSEAKHDERLALIALADNANDDGYCWTRLDRVAEKCRCHLRSVQRAIRQAEKRGEMVVIEDPGRVSIYVFAAYRRDGDLSSLPEGSPAELKAGGRRRRGGNTPPQGVTNGGLTPPQNATPGMTNPTSPIRKEPSLNQRTARPAQQTEQQQAEWERFSAAVDAAVKAMDPDCWARYLTDAEAELPRVAGGNGASHHPAVNAIARDKVAEHLGIPIPEGTS